MVYGSDCRYLPIHFSEFMLLFFMRKRTKEENTRSPPSSYEGGREGEGEGEREEGREGGREREREREREIVLFRFTFLFVALLFFCRTTAFPAVLVL